MHVLLGFPNDFMYARLHMGLFVIIINGRCNKQQAITAGIINENTQYNSRDAAVLLCAEKQVLQVFQLCQNFTQNAKCLKSLAFKISQTQADTQSHRVKG